MKSLMLITLFLASSMALAQKVEVPVNAEGEETTIHIKKGAPAQGGACDCKSQYEVTQGEDDVVGDGAVLSKEAQGNWKKACTDWKTEMRQLNKKNQIIALNCGSSSCASETQQTICRSKGTYKVKVKLTE